MTTATTGASSSHLYGCCTPFFAEPFVALSFVAICHFTLLLAYLGATCFFYYTGRPFVVFDVRFERTAPSPLIIRDKHWLWHGLRCVPFIDNNVFVFSVPLSMVNFHDTHSCTPFLWSQMLPISFYYTFRWLINVTVLDCFYWYIVTGIGLLFQAVDVVVFYFQQ